MKNTQQNIYDRETWDSLKGLLIALIVLGHINELMVGDLFGMLYSFHVSSFLFIPFIFNHDLISKENLKKIFRRYYTPFLLFVLIFIVLRFIVYKNIPSVTDVFDVLFFGTRDFLRETTGSMVLWFFPTLISTLILLMLYNISKKNLQLFLFVIMLTTHYGMHMIDTYYLMRLPIGMAIAAYLFPIGIIVAYLYKNFMESISSNSILTIALFSLLLFLYYGQSNLLGSIRLPHEIYNILLLDAIMITGFFSMLIIAHKINCTLLRTIGKKSIVIYTIHPFIIYGISLILHTDNLFISLIQYVFILGGALLIASVLDKLKLTKYIYPR